MLEKTHTEVAVYVTSKKDVNKGAHWTLHGLYPNEVAAASEIQTILRAATLDPVSGKVYRHARLVITHTYSPIGS